jgi:hypothetical protein
MAKIYLSSTYSDLKDYREAVYRILRMLRHDVIAMEDYVAKDQRPLDKCLEDVKGCDIYVGILGWRYGFIPDQDNPEQKSITELEYRQAEASGTPQLMFLVEEDAPWPNEHKDSETGNGSSGQRISEFRAEIQNDWTFSHFRTPDHLAGLVSVAVNNYLQQDKPSPRPTGSRVKEARRKLLEQQLKALLEDYQAATEQLAYTLSDVDKNRLKRQIAKLEQDMEEVEQTLDML